MRRNRLETCLHRFPLCVLEAVLRRINRGARIPLVGLVSQYNAAEPPPGPNLMPLLIKRALIQGFIVSDHPGREADLLRDVSGGSRRGSQVQVRTS